VVVAVVVVVVVVVVDLVDGLLTPDPMKRLGHRGAGEIKMHLWFRCVLDFNCFILFPQG
jgi:hypothetical protein